MKPTSDKPMGIYLHPADECMNVNRYVGECIRYFRTHLGMSQKDLGQAIGRSGKQIEKYENSRVNVPSAILFQIARVLMVSMTDLFPADHFWENEIKRWQDALKPCPKKTHKKKVPKLRPIRNGNILLFQKI